MKNLKKLTKDELKAVNGGAPKNTACIANG